MDRDGDRGRDTEIEGDRSGRGIEWEREVERLSTCSLCSLLVFNKLAPLGKIAPLLSFFSSHKYYVLFLP